MMKSCCTLCLVFFFFFLFTLPFGLPSRPVVERELTTHSTAMVGDKLYHDVVAKLNRRRPQIILIGNSMLGESVEQNRLSVLLKHPVATVWQGGMESAWWYLVVKNIILHLREKPELVGIFFRDYYLTMPRLRVSGNHKKIIDDFCSPHEVFLDNLAYRQGRGIFNNLLQYIPAYMQRNISKNAIDNWVKSLAGFFSGGVDSNQVANAISSIFAQHHLNDNLLHRRQVADEKDQEKGANKEFDPETSFIPVIIQLCKAADIKLVFIRVKRRRDLQSGMQPPELLCYIKELKRYLRKERISLIDYTDNRHIVLEDFGKGDHLNRQSGRYKFTALLASDLHLVLISDDPVGVGLGD
jgi:hypothetical protein